MYFVLTFSILHASIKAFRNWSIVNVHPLPTHSLIIVFWNFYIFCIAYSDIIWIFFNNLKSEKTVPIVVLNKSVLSSHWNRRRCLFIRTKNGFAIFVNNAGNNKRRLHNNGRMIQINECDVESCFFYVQTPVVEMTCTLVAAVCPSKL